MQEEQKKKKYKIENSHIETQENHSGKTQRQRKKQTPPPTAKAWKIRRKTTRNN